MDNLKTSGKKCECLILYTWVTRSINTCCWPHTAIDKFNAVNWLRKVCKQQAVLWSSSSILCVWIPEHKEDSCNKHKVRLLITKTVICKLTNWALIKDIINCTSVWNKFIFNFKEPTVHQSMLTGSLVTMAWHNPEVANGGDGLQIWRIPATIINKQSQQLIWSGPSSLGSGGGLTTPQCKKKLRNIL
jgi:hypothetical protein